MGRKVWDVIQGLKPTLMMVMVQIGLAGVNIFYKLAQNTALSLPVLIAYRFMFAAATVIPLALLLERKEKPKLTWKVVLLSFVCALFGGTMAQNIYAKALVLTSATFAAALTNITPAVTFILAIIFRMEGLGLKTWAGRAKIVGTSLCMGGAMLLTFYKGSEVKIWSTHFDLMHEGQDPVGQYSQQHKSHHNNILGLLLVVCCCFSSSFALILQSKMGRMYPYHYSSTAMISFMGAVQATVYALGLERDWSQWRLGWNIKLLAAAYMGIVASGVMWAFMMCCVQMRGPLFVSVFNPLMLVLVALATSLFLNEKLHLGSILGAVVIICGLYSVLWGKSKEMKKINRLVLSKTLKDPQSNEYQSHEIPAAAAAESFKGFNDSGNSIIPLAVAPNFLPEPEVFEMLGVDHQQEEDIEDRIPKPQPS